MTLRRHRLQHVFPGNPLPCGLHRHAVACGSISWFSAGAVLTTLMLLSFVADVGRAADKSPPRKDAPAKDAQAEAIRWIDNFAKDQVLFSKKDVERLRKEVAEFTPEEAQAWLERTQEVREALDSTDWLRNRLWLKDFLEVQAIYSDEQIAEFREEAKQAARESPKKFKQMLAEIDKERKKLLGGAATDAQLREQQLHLVNAYRQQEAAARQAALKAAAKQPRSGTSNKKPAPPNKTARRTRPLIDSMDAARWTIMRDLWGPLR